MACSNKYSRKSDKIENDKTIKVWVNSIKYLFTSKNEMRSELVHSHDTSSSMKKKFINRGMILGSMLVLSCAVVIIIDKQERKYNKSNYELNKNRQLKSSKSETSYSSLLNYELTNETSVYNTNNVSTSEELLFNFDYLFSNNDTLLNNSINEESNIEEEKLDYSKMEETYTPESSLIQSKEETYRPESSTNEESNIAIDEEEEYSYRPESSTLSTILPIMYDLKLRPSELELEINHIKEIKSTKESKKVKEDLDYIIEPSSSSQFDNETPIEELKHIIQDIIVPTNPSSEQENVYAPPQPLKKYSGELIFYVMGDIPYNEKEEKILKYQLLNLPNDASFLVHVGDIQSPKTTKCRESHFEKVRDILLHNSHVPTFIIPGDNDWKDCPTPDKAFNIWMKHFEKFDQHWSPLPFKVKYQRLLSNPDDKYCPSQNRPENFSFIYKNILFISIHVIGEEYEKYNTERIKRHADCAIWLKKNIRRSCRDGIQGVVVFTHKGYKKERMYSDVFIPLQDLYDEMYDKYYKRLPIIVIHGNGHKYEVSNPFQSQRKDMLDIQVDQGRSNEPLKITIDLDYFPYQPKNSKNRKGYDKKKGIQYFNSFEFDRRL